jgi:hypothetical protein
MVELSVKNGKDIRLQSDCQRGFGLFRLFPFAIEQLSQQLKKSLFRDLLIFSNNGKCMELTY